MSIARGAAPDGPFEPCPTNPIITHRGTHRPIQNTGHADLVQGPDGSWWMVLLGARPRGGTPGWHVLGRETFLAPVTWVDGWLVVGELTPDMDAPGWPLDSAAGSPVRDDFDASELAPQWISLRSRNIETCTTKERSGWLTLRARGASLDERDVNFVGRRQAHHSGRVRALIDPADGLGGIGVRIDELHHYEIEVEDGRIRVVARIGSILTTVAEREWTAGPAVLRIDVVPRTGWDPLSEPDRLRFVVEGADAASGGEGDGDGDGDFAVLAELDGRYLSTEVAGGFTGRVIGMYAARGAVHFDWFDYEQIA